MSLKKSQKNLKGISKESQRNLKRIPKESQKNPKRIPKESQKSSGISKNLKESQRISLKKNLGILNIAVGFQTD